MSTRTAERTLSLEPTAVRAWAEGRIIFVELHDGRIVGSLRTDSGSWRRPRMPNWPESGSGWPVMRSVGGTGRGPDRARRRGWTVPVTPEMQPNHSVEANRNRRPATALEPGSQFESPSPAPPPSPVAVAHPGVRQWNQPACLHPSDWQVTPLALGVSCRSLVENIAPLRGSKDGWLPCRERLGSGPRR